MRIPSKESFTVLGFPLSADERDILGGLHDEDYHSEHAAFLVATALRNNVSMNDVLKLSDKKLDAYNDVKKFIHTIDPQMEESKVDSFFWSVPVNYSLEDRIYLISAFISYGESFSSLLVSFRNSNTSNVPETVPVKWFKRFFDGEESLREEGIVLQADVSMVLFGYWGTEEVIDFLVRNVDLKEVTKLRAAGVEDLEEIADMTELLPSDWLDEFFG